MGSSLLSVARTLFFEFKVTVGGKRGRKKERNERGTDIQRVKISDNKVGVAKCEW